MAQNGIRTIDLPLLTGADDVLANSDGTTGRLSIEALLILVNSRLGPAYETLALLDADLDWPGGTLATVWGEADAALNGVYQKSGASGAGDWARIGDLPVSAISQALLDEKADQVDLDAVADQVSAIAAGLSPAGEWDPNTGAFPSGAAANTFYVASASGTVDGQTFAVGDWLIALIANPSTSAFAGNWTRANYSVVVASVFNNDLFLAKADNLTGLADPDAALMNLGGTAPGLVLFKAADVAAQQSALELQAAIDTALATGLPGTRELIEAVDLAGLVSHDFTQFDPTRFIGYEMEFVAMDIGASGGADLSLRTSADGVTFDDTPGDYTITRLANGDPADNASNSSTTSEEILLHSGLSYSAGDTSNARLTIMRPDLLAPTMIRGKWWVERTNSFEYIDLYAQRTAALPVTALRFSRRFPPNTFTAGFVYLFGIRA